MSRWLLPGSGSSGRKRGTSSIAGVVLAVCLLFLVGTAPADARLASSAEHLKSVAAASYERGASPVIPDVVCDAQCGNIKALLERTEGSPTVRQRLRQVMARLAVATKVMPPWRDFAVVSRASAALGAFTLGFEIGTGIRKKYLEEDVSRPAVPNEEVYEPIDFGQDIIGGSWGRIVAPADGWKIWSGATYRTYKLNGDYCNGMEYVPAAVEIFRAPAISSTYCSPSGEYMPSEAEVYFLRRTDYSPRATPKAPTTQSVPCCYDPPYSVTELEVRTRDTLDAGDYSDIDRLALAAKYPKHFPDPAITDEQEDHRCDRGMPAFENPDLNFGTGISTVRQTFSLGLSPNLYPDAHTVALREGVTTWLPQEEDEVVRFFGPSATEDPKIDQWTGWGYRHIKAKHGWSAVDQEETQLALSSSVPEDQGAGKFLYRTTAIASGANGVRCQRNVVVEFGYDDSLGFSREIVTSFNSLA